MTQPTRAGIREFITAHFNDNELENLCFDNFSPVGNEFTIGMSKSQKVRLLIGYTEDHGQFEDLLAILKKKREKQYIETFESIPSKTVESQDYSTKLLGGKNIKPNFSAMYLIAAKLYRGGQSQAALKNFNEIVRLDQDGIWARRAMEVVANIEKEISEWDLMLQNEHDSARRYRFKKVDADSEKKAEEFPLFDSGNLETAFSQNENKFELPAPFQWVNISGRSFSISKYPITNSQFSLFIQDGGYTNKHLWSQAGWEFRTNGLVWSDSFKKWVASPRPWSAPKYWHLPSWRKPDWPVVGVSWYEADAYTKWLTKKFNGRIISLPTESQWVYAAYGETRQNYPWGNRWMTGFCNGGESSLGRTSSVQRYEGIGDSRFGVVDMSGNVWEWTADWFDERKNSRTLKGASFKNKETLDFRVNLRRRGGPHSRLTFYGFRVASFSVKF